MKTYRHLLVALDLETDSLRLITHANALAQCFGASLALAHIVEYLPTEPAGEALVAPPISLGSELLVGARKRLADIARQAGLDRAKQYVSLGQIATELAQLVEVTGANLLIAGAHERHGLPFFTSHTERSLLRHVPCDLLVVRLPRQDDTRG